MTGLQMLSGTGGGKNGWNRKKDKKCMGEGGRMKPEIILTEVLQESTFLVKPKRERTQVLYYCRYIISLKEKKKSFSK